MSSSETETAAKLPDRTWPANPAKKPCLHRPVWISAGNAPVAFRLQCTPVSARWNATEDFPHRDGLQLRLQSHEFPVGPAAVREVKPEQGRQQLAGPAIGVVFLHGGPQPLHAP